MLDLGGQVMYKITLKKIRAKSYLDFLKKAFSTPGIWVGFTLIALGIIVWLVVLSKMDISVANSLGAMESLLMLLAARIFLGERITREKVIGTVLVTAGIVLVVLSQ